MKLVRKCCRKIAGLQRFLRGGERERYVIVEYLNRLINPSFFIGESGKTWFRKATIELNLEMYGDDALRRRWDRLWVLGEAARLTRGIPGDIVEMGVYTGASAAVMLQRGLPSKRYFGFDSFAGLSDPDPNVDGVYWKSGDLHVGYATPLHNLAPWSERISVFEGWIPQVFTLHDTPQDISLAHIDVDLYEPTYASLQWVSTRLTEGSIIVCDDYGFDTCPGATRAVDEFIERFPQWRLMHLPTGQGLIFV